MKKRIWLLGAITFLSLMVSMNAWAGLNNSVWQTSYTTAYTITAMAQDKHGNIIFKTYRLPLGVETMTLYTNHPVAPTPNPDGCYLTIADLNTTICINDVAVIVTDKNAPGKKHTDSARLIGSGSFTSTYNEWAPGVPWKGMCYVDFKATVVEDASDNVTSIKVSGKISVGASEQWDSNGNISWPGFISIDNISVTLVPIQ